MNRLNHNKSVTLLELITSITLLGIVVLLLASLDAYSHYHVINADRRARIQNELTYALEDMSKTIIRATGDINNQGIRPVGARFRVRVDNNTPPTPYNYNDDTWVTYAWSGYRITKNGASLNFQDVIISGGFTYRILDNGLGIQITLIGRYQPSRALSADNPQIQMMTRVYSHSASNR